MPWSFASIQILKMLIIFAGLFHGNLQSYRQVKTSIVICSAIFDRKGKNDGYFRCFGSLALAFCQLQIRHRDVVSAVRPHLFE